MPGDPALASILIIVGMIITILLTYTHIPIHYVCAFSIYVDVQLLIILFPRR